MRSAARCAGFETRCQSSHIQFDGNHGEIMTDGRDVRVSLLMCHCPDQIIPGPQGNDASHQCFQITLIGPEGEPGVGRGGRSERGAPAPQSSSLFTHFSQCHDWVSSYANERGERARL